MNDVKQDFAPTRNLYKWMSGKLMKGYRSSNRTGHTEFDRWMRECDFSIREATVALDIPESRVMDLRNGWKAGRIGGGIVPSFATCYAMAAIKAGLTAVPMNADCVDLRDRLAQAAFDAGLEPWPAGEVMTSCPYIKEPGRYNTPTGKRDREKEKRKKHRKRVLVPRPDYPLRRERAAAKDGPSA